MKMAVTQAMILKVRVLTYSPIRSRRFTSKSIKIMTTGKPNTVANLGEDKDFPEWSMREQDYACADHYENGV